MEFKGVEAKEEPLNFILIDIHITRHEDEHLIKGF